MVSKGCEGSFCPEDCFLVDIQKVYINIYAAQELAVMCSSSKWMFPLREKLGIGPTRWPAKNKKISH